MNIFLLDLNPAECAKMHGNRHVVKMILETCQLLCTVWLMTTPDASFIPYKKTHANHPCSKWARTSQANYVWLCELGRELCKEYTFRYGKTHKCEAIILCLSDRIPNIPDEGWTPPAQAMPDKYKNATDPVDAYREYYRHEKTHLHVWKKRDAPDWLLASS